jgi:hypothetical protein
MAGPAQIIRPFERLVLAVIALLVGIAALWVVLFPGASGLFPLYAGFSIFGWALVGGPFVLAFPAPLLCRLPWPLYPLMGALLGPLALLLIFVLLFAFQGRVSGFTLDHTETLWPFSIVVSTVSFLVYVVLLRRRLLRTPVGQ